MNNSTIMSVGVAVLLSACGGTWVQIPPSIDLARHEIIGAIDFTTEDEDELGTYTTAKFIEHMRADQGMIRVVELGSERALLASLGLNQLNRDAFQRIGEAHNLTTIVSGQLEISDIRPTVRLVPNLADISAGADVDASLSVRMVEVATGASLWSRTAEATRRVGHVSLNGGRIRLDADDPERAYGDLVQALVELVTEDFKVTWEKR